MKRLVCFLLIIAMVTPLFATSVVSHRHASNPKRLRALLQEMRNEFEGDTMTFDYGGTFDNARNNIFEWNENSEGILWTFSSNAVTMSTDSSAVFSFGTMIPNADGIDIDSYVYFNPISAAPATTEGFMYYDSDDNAILFRDDTGWVTLAAGTGDNTLNAAYDQGSSGGGKQIDVDDGAVILTTIDPDGNFMLNVTPTPGSSAATGGVYIASGANSSEDSLQIVNSGSGDDIQAGGGAFTVSSAAAVVAASLDVTGGNIVLQNDMILDQSANNAWSWTENGEDIVWTFGSDTITASSTTDVTSIDWGALAPTFGSAIVASSGMTANDDITLADGKSLKSSITTAQTGKIQVYDNDTGPGYKDAVTWTNGNTPSISIGGNAMTVAIDSSDWDISTTGVMTGIGAITNNGLITASLGADVTGATINLNASSNFAVNVASGTSTGTVTVGGTGTQTIAVGTGAGVKTVGLGSNNSSSATTILSGTGNLTINNDAGAATSGLGTGTTTGTVTIGGAGTQSINIGDGAAAKTVTLGSSNSTSTTTILSGSGTLLLNNNNNQNTLIGTGSTTGSVTIGGAGAQTIAIGDGAAAKTVSLGSANTTSTTTILSGSGTLKINVDNNQATNIGSGTSTGTVTIGGTAAQTVTIANGAAAKTVTLGSSNTTSTTNILAGSGNINVTGSVVRTGQQYVQTIGYCKVGTTGGWVVPAAADAAHLATLPQSQTNSTLIIPITIPLKVGCTITAWTINGQIDSGGNAATLDAKLFKHTEATAGFANAAVGSGMAQVAKSADYKVVEGEASLSEVVAADESFYLLVTGTTAAVTDIEIASITVTISEV